MVLVSDSAQDELLRLIDKLENKLLACNKLWHRCDNVHLSVSKTFVLSYHLITPFTSSLQKAVEEFET